MDDLDQRRGTRDHSLILGSRRRQPCGQVAIAQHRFGDAFTIEHESHATTLPGPLCARRARAARFAAISSAVTGPCCASAAAMISSRLSRSIWRCTAASIYAETPRLPTLLRTALMVPVCRDTETTVVGPSPGNASSATTPD